jgi:hypothetical protein
MTMPIRLTLCVCSTCWKLVVKALQPVVAKGKSATGLSIPASTVYPQRLVTDPRSFLRHLRRGDRL